MGKTYPDTWGKHPRIRSLRGPESGAINKRAHTLAAYFLRGPSLFRRIGDALQSGMRAIILQSSRSASALGAKLRSHVAIPPLTCRATTRTLKTDGNSMSSRPRKKQREVVSATYAYDDPPRATADDESDEEMDMDDLPAGADASVDVQLAAILEGSSDDEIITVLGQVPALDDGVKVVVAMQKLTPASSAFELCQPLVDACTNEGIRALFGKIGSLAVAQLDQDVHAVFADDPDTAAALLTHPPELRRRRFFLSLAAGYLDDE
jgi:hypothetical protein